MDTDRAGKTRRARRARSVSSDASIATRVVDRDATRISIAFPDETPPLNRALVEKTAYRLASLTGNAHSRTRRPLSNQETGVFRGRILREALRLSDFVDFD